MTHDLGSNLNSVSYVSCLVFPPLISSDKAWVKFKNQNLVKVKCLPEEKKFSFKTCFFLLFQYQVLHFKVLCKSPLFPCELKNKDLSTA